MREVPHRNRRDSDDDEAGLGRPVLSCQFTGFYFLELPYIFLSIFWDLSLVHFLQDVCIRLFKEKDDFRSLKNSEEYRSLSDNTKAALLEKMLKIIWRSHFISLHLHNFSFSLMINERCPFSCLFSYTYRFCGIHKTLHLFSNLL